MRTGRSARTAASRGRCTLQQMLARDSELLRTELEAGVGIEPAYTALQGDRFPCRTRG